MIVERERVIDCGVCDYEPRLPLRQSDRDPEMLLDARGQQVLWVMGPAQLTGDERQAAAEYRAAWVLSRVNAGGRQTPSLREYAAVQLMAATIAAGGDAWGDDRAAGRAVSAADALLRALARGEANHAR